MRASWKKKRLIHVGVFICRRNLKLYILLERLVSRIIYANAFLESMKVYTEQHIFYVRREMLLDREKNAFF